MFPEWYPKRTEDLDITSTIVATNPNSEWCQKKRNDECSDTNSNFLNKFRSSSSAANELSRGKRTEIFFWVGLKNSQ